jgi:hypothetical protein
LFLNERTQKVAVVHLQEGGTNVPTDDENDSPEEETRSGFALF